MRSGQAGSSQQTRLGTDELRRRLVLHVLTDRNWSHGRSMVEIVGAAIAGGATVIQLRDKVASTRVLVEEGLALRRLTREHGVLLIVNDRIDVALAADADGAHIGQDDMPVPVARSLLGRERILGVSAGNLAEAVEAVAGGADYLGIGPIYTTQSKEDAGPATGTRLLTEIAAHLASTPLVAIGGIHPKNASAVIHAGATGVAVMSAVVGAGDVTAATRTLLTCIRQSF